MNSFLLFFFRKTHLDASNPQCKTNRDILFANNIHDDITTASGTVTCLNATYTTGILNCAGCTGSYVVAVTCPLCSPSSPASCPTCPQGTFGGAEAEIDCRLCASGYTTVYPPSSTSSSDCVPITSSPTTAPTFAPGSPTPVPTPVRLDLFRYGTQGSAANEINGKTKF